MCELEIFITLILTQISYSSKINIYKKNRHPEMTVLIFISINYSAAGAGASSAGAAAGASFAALFFNAALQYLQIFTV